MGNRFAWAQLTVALLLAAATSNGLSAQAYEPSAQNPQALEVKAEGYLQDQNKWNRAADLYRQAAALRDPGDAVAVADLKVAARLEYYRGHERTAVRDLENAGQRAIAMGDVLAAANAFVDAAWIANADGRSARAKELADRAQLLAMSPLISPRDRAALEDRFPASP